MEPVQCYARAALSEWRDANRDAGPDVLLGVSLNDDYWPQATPPDPDE